MTTTRTAVAVATLAALSGIAAAGPFNEWNLIVRNDLAFSSSEVDGSTIVGGSILGGTSNYAVQGVTASNGDGLAIGGILGPGVSVDVNNGGNFRIGSAGAIQGTANVNGGTTIFDPGVAAQAASFANQAASASAFLSGLATTGTITGDANNGTLVANSVMMDGQNVAVFNLTAAQFTAYGTLGLDLAGADSVIINISADGSGLVDLTAPPNLTGDFSQANSNRIMWNLFDATEVVSNNNINGAVFATNAALTLNGGGINGTVVVDSIDLQSSEIRLTTYTGFLPTPGTAAMLAVGGLLATRRRR